MRRLIKISRNLENPNLITIADIEDELEFSTDGKDLLNPDVWEKVTSNDYADELLRGVIIRNFDIQLCLIEVHEYICIDESDHNYGKSRCAVFIIPIDKNRKSIGNYTFKIINDTAKNIKSYSSIDAVTLVKSDAQFERIKNFLLEEKDNDRFDKKDLLYL